VALVALLDSSDPEIRLAAIKEYYDRLCGKAVAIAEADVRTQTLSIQEMYLQAIQMKPAPLTIDTTPAQANAGTTTLPAAEDFGGDNDGNATTLNEW
jgi:hypothetical protein